MTDISFFVAFGAGVLSFLSPCIFPLVPSILGYIAAGSAGDFSAHFSWRLMRRTALFVLGFSLVFVGLGFLVGFFGLHVRSTFPWLTQIAGLFLIVFGLHAGEFIRIPLLDRHLAVRFSSERVAWFAPILAGLSFGLGWSPCMGPIIGGILTLAYASDTVWQGTFLLVVYSMGLGVPFLASAAFFPRLMGLARSTHKARVFFWVKKISGILLIAIGVLVFTDTLVLLNGYFSFLPKP